jgi:Concanavalin A-like lectin/glucanases superfamily
MVKRELKLDLAPETADFSGMKTTLLHLSTLAVLIVSLNHVVAADAPPPRLAVELRDGSRIVGECLDKKIKFKSALLGDIELPIQDIESVDSVSSNSVTLTTSTGDTLTVSFADSDLPVKADFGKVDLPVDSILKIMVATGVPGSNLPGLVGLWSGQNSGKDMAGGNDASVPPGVTTMQALTGPGFYFDGGANQVMVPNAPGLNFGPGQDFSIEAWVEPAPPPPYMKDDILTLVDKRNTPSFVQCHGYTLAIYGGKISFRFSDNINENGNDWEGNGPDLFDGKFHQLAVTVIRNSTEGGKLYVDGKRVLTFDPTQQTGDLSTDRPLIIGGNTCPGYYAYFHGLIDHIGIYNRALSADEIKSLSPPPNLGVKLPPGRAGGVPYQPGQPLHMRASQWNQGFYDYPDWRPPQQRVIQNEP